MKPQEAPPRPDARYESIFEHSAVSLWEEDISKLRARLASMRRTHGFDLRAHIDSHPEFVREAASLIDVTDVNLASLRLFEAHSKKQLLGPLNVVLDAVYRAALSETIIAIDEGTNDIETESNALTLNGRKLSLLIKTHVPAADAAYSRMLVSHIDITARKEAEEQARASVNILHSIIESSPDLILIKDTRLRMVLCNSALAHNIGKEPEETYGKSDIENGWSVDLVKGNEEKGIAGWEKDDLAVLAGETIRVASEPSDFNKGIRYYETAKFPLRDSSGTIIGLIGIGRDISERLRAAADLAWERSLFNTLMDTLPDRIYFKDMQSRFIRTSRSHAKSWGLDDPLEEIGKTDADYSSSEHSRKALADEQQVMRTGVPMIDVEDQVRSPEGKVGWFLTTRMPLRDSAGKIIGTFGITHDITRRKQVEADLERERYFFTALMENLPDYIYIKDSASRFIRTSRSHARVLGLRDPSEAVGKTDFDFYREDHARKAYDDEMQIMRTGVPLVDAEERESYPDRPDTWVLTTKMPLHDATGAIIGTFGITHDITLRRQLQGKNEQLAALVEFADDAIVGLDMNRRITVWNKGAERVYGYTAEEMIAAPTSTLIPSELEEEARAIREKIMSGEQVDHFETTRIRKGGTRITVALTLSAIRDATGKIVGMASVARDITEQKAIEGRLNRARRLEGLATLAGGVAHQFNNINTAVKGYLDLVRMEEGLSNRVATYLKAASASVQKAVDITDRLLALTQPTGAAIGSVRLDVLARSVLGTFAPRIESENVEIVLELAETPAVEGDESRLRFVLSSLIGNALDSLLDCRSRVVRVRTSSTSDGASLEVEDSGCGIGEADLPRIFSPFFSGKGEWAPAGSPQWKLKGVGLSLAISSTTISEYGGRIDVQSTKGIGSTFRIFLPTAPGQV
jgi:PAS domain S-box-containing protein